MNDRCQIGSYCGLICDTCEYYKGEKEPNCPGCLECKGKPFWGTCDVASCVLEKNLEHCGLCSEFPCTKLPEHFDPSNPQGKKEAIFRIGQLAIRAKIGTKQWLAKISDGSLVRFEKE